MKRCRKCYIIFLFFRNQQMTFAINFMYCVAISLTFICMTASARERIATPGDVAQKQFEAASAAAQSSQKALAVHFTATWCGICKLYDALYVDPAAKAIFDKHQIITKIDFEKTPGGRELYEKFEHNESVPAYSYYDPRGKWVASSNATTRTTGNIGYPMNANELAHYEKSILAALTNASDDEIKTIMSRVKAIYSAKQSSSR
jgi:thiol-disulfide isomerase/thioredoxin